jgi:hypothetical protein
MGKGKQSSTVIWFKILKSTIHRTVLSFFLIRTGADAQLDELGPMTPVSIILLSCFHIVKMYKDKEVKNANNFFVNV